MVFRELVNGRLRAVVHQSATTIWNHVHGGAESVTSLIQNLLWQTACTLEENNYVSKGEEMEGASLSGLRS